MNQLQGQVGVASTPSDLREMLHTVTLLAKVVAETSTELTDSALKVRFQSYTGSQTHLGAGGSSSIMKSFSAFLMSCGQPNRALLRVQVLAPASSVLKHRSPKPWKIKKT